MNFDKETAVTIDKSHRSSYLCTTSGCLLAQVLKEFDLSILHYFYSFPKAV